VQTSYTQISQSYNAKSLYSKTFRTSECHIRKDTAWKENENDIKGLIFEEFTPSFSQCILFPSPGLRSIFLNI
jgi:hypothetical protein